MLTAAAITLLGSVSPRAILLGASAVVAIPFVVYVSMAANVGGMAVSDVSDNAARGGTWFVWTAPLAALGLAVCCLWLSQRSRRSRRTDAGLIASWFGPSVVFGIA